MNNRKTISTALIIGAVLVALTGCQKQEGPAERAGKAVDNAATKVGDKVEKAGDAVKDATQGAKP